MNLPVTMSSSSGAPPPGGSQDNPAGKTTRSIAGGKSFKRKFAAINKRLLEGTISVEEAEQINSFGGKFEVDPSTNQLVRSSQLNSPTTIPTTVAGKPVYPAPVPVIASASSSTSPYSGAAFTVRQDRFSATVPEDKPISVPRPRLTIPSESPQIRQERIVPKTGATPKLAGRSFSTLTPAAKRSVSFQEDSLRPSSQEPASSSSGGTVIARNPEPPNIGLPFIALDLHHTLDDGSSLGTIPEVNVAACRQLRSKGVGTWVCSYIGRTGPNSQRVRENAEEHVRDLAEKLDISFEDSHLQGPRLDNLFFVIVNRKNWVSFPDKQGYLNGKVSALLHWNTKVLIDDKLTEPVPMKPSSCPRSSVTTSVRSDMTSGSSGIDNGIAARSSAAMPPLSSCAVASAPWRRGAP